MTSKENTSSWRHNALVPAQRRQGQADLRELEVDLLCIVSFRQSGLHSETLWGKGMPSGGRKARLWTGEMAQKL